MYFSSLFIDHSNIIGVFGLHDDTDEINDPIFDKVNVEYRITKSSKRQLRFNTSLTKEEEIVEYVNMLATVACQNAFQL